MEFIITIDGPAGAGKSTVARKLAGRFGYAFLDTGAMYRAVTLSCLRRHVDWNNSDLILQIAQSIEIRFVGANVFLDGTDVSAAIREPEVAQSIHYVANNAQVRSVLRGLQQRIGHGQRIVTEGRDQGTEVFPEAQCKFFLTASPEVRADRRCRELNERGKQIAYEEVLADQMDRDSRDAQRPVGALRPAADAIIIDTDNLSHDEVVDRLTAHVCGLGGRIVDNAS